MRSSLVRRILTRRNVTTGKNGGVPRLVIVGTGWGGYSVLKNIDKKFFEVIVVSIRNHFLFTPLLASTSVGTLEFRSVVEPVRNAGFRRAEHFMHARALQLLPDSRTLRCASYFRPDHVYDVPYDKLVIAVGALTNTFNTPGAQEHARFLKEIGDARAIRTRLLENFEVAMQPNVDKKEKQRLLHFVIVGGGPTGVEFGAELYDFIKQDVGRLYHGEAKNVRVTLVEAAQILGSFDAKLRTYAEKQIQTRQGFYLIQSHVTEVKVDCVLLADGSVLPCGLTVWCTGLSPRPFTQNLDVPKNKSGQIVTDEFLKVKSISSGDVYALGDCADIEIQPLPCTAQVAEQQGRYLADSLKKSVTGRGSKVKPFKFKGLGMLAYIGAYEGISDTKQLKIKGVASWVLWRSAYLTRLGSWRLRMQVPFDWFKTFFFGRDTSRF